MKKFVLATLFVAGIGLSMVSCSVDGQDYQKPAKEEYLIGNVNDTIGDTGGEDGELPPKP